MSTILSHQPIPCIMVCWKCGKIVLDKNIIQLLEKVDLVGSFNNSSTDSKISNSAALAKE